MKSTLLILMLIIVKTVTYSQVIYSLDTLDVKDFSFENDNLLLLSSNNTTSIISKINHQNQIVWSKTIGNNFEIMDLTTINNEIYLSTHFYNGSSHLNNISKINSNGIIQWTKSTFSTEYNYFKFTEISGWNNANQNIVFFSKKNNNIQIYSIDDNGNELWKKEIPTQNGSPNWDAKLITDSFGNIYFSYCYVNDFYLTKIDANGNLLFHKKENFGYWCDYWDSNLIRSPNGNLLILLKNSVPISTEILEYDTQGNYVRGFSYASMMHNISFLSDSNYIYQTGIIFNPDPINGSPYKYSYLIQLDTSLSIINDVSCENCNYLNELQINSSDFYLSFNNKYSKFDSSLKFTCDSIDLNYSRVPLGTPSTIQYFYQTNNINSMFSSSFLSYNSFINRSIDCIGLNNMETDKKIEFQFSIYPNPSSSFFNLEFEEEYQNLNYSIHDILGKEILSGKINSSQTRIDCENWSEGVYLIKMGNENGYRVEKMVVEK